MLTREDIERTQAVQDLPLLAREAGLQLDAQRRARCGNDVFLRGAPASQVLLLIDGVPQTRQGRPGSLGSKNLMLDQVERVEVARGNVRRSTAPARSAAYPGLTRAAGHAG